MPWPWNFTYAMLRYSERIRLGDADDLGKHNSDVRHLRDPIVS